MHLPCKSPALDRLILALAGRLPWALCGLAAPAEALLPSKLGHALRPPPSPSSSLLLLGAAPSACLAPALTAAG